MMTSKVAFHALRSKIRRSRARLASGLKGRTYELELLRLERLKEEYARESADALARALGGEKHGNTQTKPGRRKAGQDDRDRKEA